MAQSRSVLNDLSHALALLESENDRLSDDNALLQEIVTDDELRIRKLLEENAKLRKLASDMRGCLNDKCSWCQKFGNSCSTERNRRELGVEVDLWAG